MTKLCPRGKAAAKRKFKVYPSAYANAYASKICAGKIKDPSGVKRKDFKGPKPAKAMGGRIRKVDGGEVSDRQITKRKESIFKKRPIEKNMPEGVKKQTRIYNAKVEKYNKLGIKDFKDVKRAEDEGRLPKRPFVRKTKFKAMGGRIRKMGGGMTMMPRAMYKKGGKSFPDLSGDGKVTMKDVLMGRGVIKRPKKKGGGLMEATSRLRAQGLKMGGIARGCGAVMSDRRKKTKMY